MKLSKLYNKIIALLSQALFSDSSYDETDQISKVRREVDEVKDVMTQNIGMD